MKVGSGDSFSLSLPIFGPRDWSGYVRYESESFEKNLSPQLMNCVGNVGDGQLFVHSYLKWPFFPQLLLSGFADLVYHLDFPSS